MRGAISISTKSPTVVVIGGGTTGTSIVRDAAMRGFRAILIERDELGSGTSGNFHGILHSGARYALRDPDTAAECFLENQILRRIAPSAITDTGGLFLAFDEVEYKHADMLMKACGKAGIPTEEIPVDTVRQREPHISSALGRVFTVPDGFIDGEELIRLNVKAAIDTNKDVKILRYREVIKISRKNDAVAHLTVLNKHTQKIEVIKCDYIVNACGVWSSRIAQLAGCRLDMVYDKGTMIVYKKQLSSAVLNRCRPENDGDLLVPNGRQSVMGTTARVIENLEDCEVTKEEIDLLRREAAVMVPDMVQVPIEKVFAGIRPLYQATTDQKDVGSRGISRSYYVIDHGSDGLRNFISVVGGKVTTSRRMAEAAVDLLCVKSGTKQKSQTAVVPL